MLKEWEVQTIFEQYEELYLRLRDEMKELERLKNNVRDHVLEVGKTVAHGNIKATYKKGYVRVSWDGKKLDGYAAAHPEILPFRGETEVGPSVSITVTGGDR